jgi:hypothetical protein
MQVLAPAFAVKPLNVINSKLLKPPDVLLSPQLTTISSTRIALPFGMTESCLRGTRNIQDNTMTFTEKLAALEAEMIACEQTAGMSVLRHGELVRDHFQYLIAHLREQAPLEGEWRLPEWIHDPRILAGLMPDDIIKTYALYHDCGKPSVRVVDEEGRQHFPGHAAASERVWREIGGDEQVARLIGMDMDIHTIKDVDVEAFAARPEAATLMLVGLSEIHANASMFGGVESVSFKMKWKQIDKRGRAILKLW